MENKRKKEASSMAGNGSRWQPTKDQIDILESVYSAGVKTPSADQIQQITARLSVYGHIEGKNVFYWFQNTKARRRQKLKQDRLAFLTTPTTHFYPPPYYSPPNFIPNVEAGYYYYPCEQVDQGLMTERAVGPVQVEARRWVPCESTSIKTLELFPLRPGGSKMEIISGGGGDNSTDSNCSDQTMNDEYSACKAVQGFIDFFSANSSAATDETVFIN